MQSGINKATDSSDIALAVGAVMAVFLFICVYVYVL